MLSHTGVWLDKQHAEDNHVHDNVLSNALVEFFKQEFKNENKSILDLGCGKGDYVKNLRKNGFDADGLDGNPHTKDWFNDAIIHDLSVETKFEKKYNWILTLEVAEHLPKELEFSFISNVHNNNTDGIVMSWAIKGQGGWGHFNEQDNEYVIDLFEKKGYLYDMEQSEYFRNNCELSWFKKTILVFRKQFNNMVIL